MYAEIPEAIRRKVEPQLAGIYFVDDIGGTGFTDEIFDRSGGKPLGVIVLDPSVLTSRTANAWATWKDNTPFKPDAAWALSERIEDAARDDAAHAIQYILLHEIGHVLSIGRRAHPSWTVDLKTLSSTREYPYFNLSWTIRDGGYVPLPVLDFPNRRNVAFYFGAKLEASAMTETYSGLEQTNFPTLYAATHPGDDFADAFANYVHVVMLGRPYEIRITHEGKVVKAYVSCWKQERCAAKRRLLEELVQ